MISKQTGKAVLKHLKQSHKALSAYLSKYDKEMEKLNALRDHTEALIERCEGEAAVGVPKVTTGKNK